MLKKFRKKMKNQGNTFIMVVVTLSFLAILTAAILVAIALCYRLKIMDINSRDNFYYLEQAMDEIYAGVGRDSLDNLNDAYTSTLEVIVYYDTDTKSYVTMDNDAANKLLKTTYMRKIREESPYKNRDQALERIRSFVTNAYADDNPSGILVNQQVDNTGKLQDDGKLQVDLSTKPEKDNVTLLNLKLSRTASYSTMALGKRGVTNEKNKPTGDSGTDKFTQTISTDLVIGEPQLDVKFDMIDATMNNLFSFSLIADKGVEISDSEVNITGDVYAAADFYNKDYNGDVTNVSTQTSVEDPINDSNAVQENTKKKITKQDIIDMYSVPVSSYGTKTASKDTTTDSRYLQQNGTDEKSMYSGLYMSNSQVNLTANKVIVPGTIAAMNVSTFTVSAINGNMVGKTDIWADNITLGGYSAYRGENSLKGSTATLNANCYISDDLEVNANSSSVALIGEYYGYNNSTTDTRSFSKVFLQKNGIFTLTADSDNNKIENGKIVSRAKQTGQEHYNSSSVIINGDNATLDLKDVSAMYIAGQSYIEIRKDNTKTEQMKDPNASEDDENNMVTVQKYTYVSPNTNTGDINTDDKLYYDTTYSDGTKIEGNVTKQKNGSKDTETVRGSAVQDYKTGEAVSIKSNQLAYGYGNIPASSIEPVQQSDGTTKYYVKLNSSVLKTDAFKKAWKDKNLNQALEMIPVIKTVVSGKDYYYFDFESADTTNKNVNQFIADYSKIFAKDSTDASKKYLTDITDYEEFQVNMLRLPSKTNSSEPDYNKIYSNSALTVKYGNVFSIKADSDNTAALVQAAYRINTNEEEKGKDDSVTTEKVADATNKTGTALSREVTNALRDQYKEMKLLLSASSADSDGVALAHTIKDSAITPINYYFKFSNFDKDKYTVIEKKDESGNVISKTEKDNVIKTVNSDWIDKKGFANTGYAVYLSSGDVEVKRQSSTSGAVKGIVIAKGDVTFDGNGNDSVDSFEGIIVSGGKIIVDHNMDFIANEEIVKSILRTCEDGYTTNGDVYSQMLSLFRSYGGSESSDQVTTDENYETTRSISTIQFEDILEFKNWKKNVD